MSCVLVIGLESNIALAAVRSLGARGIQVIGISRGPNALGASSRFLTKEYVLEWNPSEPELFVNNVFHIACTHKCNALMTPSETYMRLFNEYRLECPEGLNYCFPSAHILECVLCKEQTIPLARAAGLRAPATFVATNADDLHIIADSVEFPVIMKFSSVGPRPPGNMWCFKTCYVGAAEELHRLADSFAVTQTPLLVQEYALGSYVGLGIARSKGEVIAAFQWTALREYEAGLGSYRVSMEPDQDLLDKSSALLAAIDYEGVAEVEFRKNQSNGTYSFMEVNPRLWGGVALPIACGVDFPWLSYCIATDTPVKPVRSYMVGMYSRNLSGDVHWLLNAMRGRYANEHPNMRYFPVQSLKEFFMSLGKKTVFDQENFNDVGPLFKSILNKTKSLLANLRINS